MIIYCMINIISQCVICGSPVSDLVEPEVEKQGQLKAGHYVDNRWICNYGLSVYGTIALFFFSYSAILDSNCKVTSISSKPCSKAFFLYS